ncbi:MAG: PLP-dependent aminotransferase family protein [Ahrensia sp.]
MPTLPDMKGPLYVRLADAIERDIDSGALAEGTKLPPHRNLAFDIGVTVGTVSRAYAIVRERGLVAGEVGRGTYVKATPAATSEQSHPLARYSGLLPRPQPNLITMNSTSAPNVGQADIIARHMAELVAHNPTGMHDYLRDIADEWRAAGKQWMTTEHWSPNAENVLPTQGSHGGLMAVINTVSLPGDRIAFEELTYPITVRASALMGRRTISITSTDQGIDPDAFEQVCAQQHPKIAVIVSTYNNPTLTTIPLENRLRIVESARRHNVLILDDDTFGVLSPNPPPPFSALAPERTFHVTSLSKSVAAGLRAGWVACPNGYGTRVMNAHRVITGGAPRAFVQIAAQMVLNGEADALRQTVRAKNAERVQKARLAFSRANFKSDINCPFIWLQLPDHWVPSAFCKAARAQDVLLEEADTFKTSQLDRPVPYVRVALTGALDDAGLDRGLATIASLLEQPMLAYGHSE